MTDDIEKLAGDLLEQIERSGYRDSHGHPLEMNVAYLRLRERLAAKSSAAPTS